MAVRKIKNSWWVDFRSSHQRYRKRSPENSKTGAQAYEALLRQKLARGGTIEMGEVQQRQNSTFEDFARRWMVDYVAANNKPSEQRTKRYILEASLIPFFGKTRVIDIAAQQIERYKARCAEERVSNKTIKNRLTVLNKCLGCAYEWLAIEKKPPRIVWPKCLSGRTDYLSLNECEALVSKASDDIRDMIVLALRTGMRQGELRGLQWECIDWQTRSLSVRYSRCDYQRDLVSPKGNRERHIPLDAEIYAMLYRRKQRSGYVFADGKGSPYGCKRLLRRLETVSKAAGLRKIGWHVLRHTFATQLAMQGVPLPTVQALLGHASITTTMRYAHVAPSTLRSAIEMLNPKVRIDQEFGQPVGNRWIAMNRSAMHAEAQARENPGLES